MLALKTARQLKQQVPEEMLLAQTDFLDAFMPTDLHVLVRFGQWDKILAYPEPADVLATAEGNRRPPRGSVVHVRVTASCRVPKDHRSTRRC